MNHTEAQAIVDDIKTLHAHCVSAAEIAGKLHLPERIIRHAIEHGRLPAQQPQCKPPTGRIEA